MKGAFNLVNLAEVIKVRSRKECKTLSRRQLIDKLNSLHACQGTILVTFRHCLSPHSLSIKAFPQPCHDETLHLRYRPSQEVLNSLKDYSFDHFLLDDGLKLFLVQAELRNLDGEGLVLGLPEECQEILTRHARRHCCHGVQVRFLQDGAHFEGILEDFSPDCCRVRLESRSSQRFFWIDRNAPGYLILFREGETLFSGDCTLIRQGYEEKAREFIFRLANRSPRRFQNKGFRGGYQRLTPTPKMTFIHPLTRNETTLGIKTISRSGFVVEEEEKEAILFPGLMLPSVTISLDGGATIACWSQVVNRKVVEGEDTHYVRHEVAYLDMDRAYHTLLETVLLQAGDSPFHGFKPVDFEALWKFFQEREGFPAAHDPSLAQKNGEFKKNYEKLYSQNPDIGRHFIHQDNGHIRGQASMVRLFENSWLIHHHIGQGKEANHAGLMILNQIAGFIDDSLNLFSCRMNYVLSYFDPEKRLPGRIFKGAARYLKDREKCSLDAFAYLPCVREEASLETAAPDWEIVPCTDRDVFSFEFFYEEESGGLMPRAMDLQPDTAFLNSVEKDCRKRGFRQEKHLLALKRDGVLLAVLLLDLSEMGLNLLNFTPSLHFFVVNPTDLDKKTLYDAVGEVMRRYHQSELPTLLYPLFYADAAAISYEKTYHLWIMNLRYAEEYFRHLKRFLRDEPYRNL